MLLIDILKTALPVFAAALYMSLMFDMWQFGAQFAGLFCMLGHCFPVWYGFKGGKAFIAGFATIWFVDWRMTLIAMAIFFLLLFTLKYMSVASCTAALQLPDLAVLSGLLKRVGRGFSCCGGGAGHSAPLPQLCKAGSRNRVKIQPFKQALSLIGDNKR